MSGHQPTRPPSQPPARPAAQPQPASQPAARQPPASRPASRPRSCQPAAQPLTQPPPLIRCRSLGYGAGRAAVRVFSHSFPAARRQYTGAMPARRRRKPAPAPPSPLPPLVPARARGLGAGLCRARSQCKWRWARGSRHPEQRHGVGATRTPGAGSSRRSVALGCQGQHGLGIRTSPASAIAARKEHDVPNSPTQTLR